MAKFVVLLNFTEQGIRNVKETPDRIERLEKYLEKVGGKLVDWYLTMGEYDAVAIFEMEDDETMAHHLLAVGRAGNLRTRTLRAFTRDDFKRIVEKL